MTYLFQPTKKPICLSSAFKGQIIKCKPNLLTIKTDFGEMMLHCNSSTRYYSINHTPFQPFQFYDQDFITLRKKLLDQYVSGTMVIYPTLNKKEIHLLCIELFMHGCETEKMPQMSPSYWKDALISMAEWWLEYSLDEEYGGYYTNLREHGQISTYADGRDKWGYMISRSIYAFSVAFALSGEEKLLDAARKGVDFMINRIAYERKGYLLFRGHVDRQGNPYLEKTDWINIFSQFYGLTGLIAFFEITRDSKVEQVIEANLHTLVDLYHDKKYGGFYDAISEKTLKPIKGVTDSKSANSIIDPFNAILYLLDEANFKSKYLNTHEVIQELISIVHKHFVVNDENFMREVFRRSWDFAPPKWYNPYNTHFLSGNIGGNNKIIWSTIRGWDLLDTKTQEHALYNLETIHKKMISSGAWDSFRGGWFDVMSRSSKKEEVAQHTWHLNKVWWQQEAGILGYLIFYLHSGKKEYLKIAREGIQFWSVHFFDRMNGGVFDTVSPDGLPINRWKGSWLKCSYHETELARFAHIYLSVIHKKPISLFYAISNDKTEEDYFNTPSRIPYGKWQIEEKKRINPNLLKVFYHCKQC